MLRNTSAIELIQPPEAEQDSDWILDFDSDSEEGIPLSDLSDDETEELSTHQQNTVGAADEEATADYIQSVILETETELKSSEEKISRSAEKLKFSTESVFRSLALLKIEDVISPKNSPQKNNLTQQISARQRETQRLQYLLEQKMNKSVFLGQLQAEQNKLQAKSCPSSFFAANKPTAAQTTEQAMNASYTNLSHKR